MINQTKLQARLRAIEEIKSERYVGTQEVWRYLNQVSAIYEIPQNLAEQVNKSLSEDSIVYYPATPERILGLYDSIEEILVEGRTKEVVFDTSEYGSTFVAVKKLSPVNEDEEKLDLMFFPWHSLFRDVKVQQVMLQQSIYDFGSFQYPSMNDDSFGQQIGRRLANEFPLTPKFKEEFIEKVENADWQDLLSRNNLSRIEGKLLRQVEGSALLEDNTFGLEKRFKRMQNDKVLNKPNYRRELILDYIRGVATSFPDAIMDYDDLRENVYRGLASWEIMQEEAIVQEAAVDTKTYKDKIEFLQFMSNMLVAESPWRSFVDRFLKS